MRIFCVPLHPNTNIRLPAGLKREVVVQVFDDLNDRLICDLCCILMAQQIRFDF